MAQLTLRTFWYFGVPVRSIMVSDSKTPGSALLYETGCAYCGSTPWTMHKENCPVQYDECAMVQKIFHKPLKQAWDIWNKETAYHTLKHRANLLLDRIAKHLYHDEPVSEGQTKALMTVASLKP